MEVPGTPQERKNLVMTLAKAPTGSVVEFKGLRFVEAEPVNAPWRGPQIKSCKARRKWWFFGPWVVKVKYEAI